MKKLKPDTLGDLAPSTVLHWYDGPLIYFSFHNDVRYLVYYYTAHPTYMSYFVRPVNNQDAAALTDNISDVRDILLGLPLYMVNFYNEGSPEAMELFQFDSIDEVDQDAIPDAGVKLRPVAEWE